MEMKEVDMASRIEPLLTVADIDAFPEDDGNRYELIDTSTILPGFQLPVSAIFNL